MSDFTRFKNPVVQLERILSFVKNILTEEKYRRTDNIAKNFLFTRYCKSGRVKYQQQTYQKSSVRNFTARNTKDKEELKKYIL